MIELPEEWGIVQQNIEQEFSAYEVRRFYEAQEALYTGIPEDDLEHEERRIHGQVMQYIKHNATEAQIVIWEQTCYNQYYQRSKTTKALEENEPSPYDLDNFIMDLLPVADAKPIPALFNLPDHKGNPQLFMPRGKVTILASEGGVGKSLLTMHLAISIALKQKTHARSWCGQYLEPLPRSGKVVLLYGEEDRQSCLYRLRRQLGTGDNDRVDPDLLRRLSGRLIPVPLCLTDRNADTNLALSDSMRSKETGAERRRDRLYESLESIAGEDGLDLIVIDPLAQFGGSDFEVDNGEASRLMRYIQQFAGIKGNPAILVVHHMNKGAKKGKLINSIRGSSAIRDNSRASLVLKRAGENEKGENQITDMKGRRVLELILAKTNYGEEGLSVRYISHKADIIPIKGMSEEEQLLKTQVPLKTQAQSQEGYEKAINANDTQSFNTDLDS